MFWAALRRDDQQAIEAVGIRRTYEAGIRLFDYGDDSSFAVVILTGLVKLTRSSIDGREIMIELRGDGSVVGEMGVVDDCPRSTSAIVIDDVAAITIQAPAFRQLLNDRGSIASAALSVVTDKLRQATDRRLESGVGDTRAQLCGRLAELADRTAPGSDGAIEINYLTQQDLAEWIGVSRDGIVQAFRYLRSKGWVETGRRTIRIYDLDALRAAAVE